MVTDKFIDSNAILDTNDYRTKLDEGNISILQFPSNIGATTVVDEPQQGHYTVIYINEVVAGRFKKNIEDRKRSGDSPVFLERGSSTNQALSRSVQNQLQNFDGEKKVKFATAVGAVAAEGAAIIGGVIGAVSGVRSEGVAGGVVGAIVAATGSSVAAAAVGATAAYFLEDILKSATLETLRTKFVIALPMPDNLETGYSTNWESQGGIESQLVGFAGGIVDQIASGKAKDVVSNAVKTTGSILARNAFRGTGLFNSAVNPRTQMLFSGVNFRGWNFSWTMYPRNAEEAKAIWDIIEILKYHALPEYDEASGGLFLYQPALFDIEFHQGGERNDYLPKTLSCALVDIKVNYTPANIFTAFEPYKDPKTNRLVSAPVGVILSLSFQENEILTKNRISPSSTSPSAPKSTPQTIGEFGFNQGSGPTNGTF